MGEIKIGKNAIENLTRGMYEDSKIIYREYIQNSADQIDYAIKNSLFSEELFIDIRIDKSGRNVTIKDNATGVKKDMIESTLADVADSDKVKGETKGFRGIGRLGGLAYCDKLRFITTAQGDNQKTIMTWDAKALSQMLDDGSVKDNAGTVLQNIIIYEWEDCPIDDHYFIVELLGIKNENFDLLDTEKVRQYIALNAPVPYDSKFYYKQQIHEYLQKKGFPKNDYKIFVDSEDILKLGYFFSTILHTLYFDANRAKNAFKKEIDLYKKEDEYAKKQGRFLNDRERQKIEQEIVEAKAEDTKAKKDIERLKTKAKSDDVFHVVFTHIEDNHNKALADNGFSTTLSKPLILPVPPATQTPKKKKNFLVDELSDMPDKQRKLVSRIYDVIARNLPPEQSEELISKIQEELKNAKKNSAD